MQLWITGQNQEKKLKGYIGGQKKKKVVDVILIESIQFDF